MVDADGVERDVEGPGGRRHGVGVPPHRLLVQRVDHGRVGLAAGGHDLAGERVEGRRGAAGEEHPRTLTGERPGNGAPDGAGRSVDDGVLVLE